MKTPRYPHKLPTRKKRQRNRDRIARAITFAVTHHYTWKRTNPLPENRDGAAGAARERAEAKRERRRVLRLSSVAREGRFGRTKT